MGALFPEGMEDSFGDMIEIRYNKKRGSHDNLTDGAVRIVYKFKTDAAVHDLKCQKENPRIRYRVRSDIAFHIVQYMEKLPDYVDEKIKQDQEIQNTKLRQLEELLKKEKDAEISEKEAQDSQASASSFGRRRKPNSRYLNLYKVELAATRNYTFDDKSDDDYEDYDDDEEDIYGESFDSVGVIGRRGFSRGRRGRPTKGRGRGSKHGNKIWMAGYGLEKTKPKSSSLFRMCDDEEEEDENIEEEYHKEESNEFESDTEKVETDHIERKIEGTEIEELPQLISKGF